ncbi:MAG: Mur ligase [Planctomycetes bacterium]|nr:Mur ligase [Planctomycetota bacterium]MCB9903023.1 Mur ligase [Planctomycetota bacterium]
MELLDSRRLTGANILSSRPGAVIDVAIPEAERARVIAAWGEHARRLLDALGWDGEQTFVRESADGASLAISAPIDVLYAATEVNESAWTAAVAEASGLPAPDTAGELGRLRAEIDAEANPALLALRTAAIERGVAFLSDDDLVSVGMGTGSRTWPRNELPAPSEVDWSALRDVPTAMITGTNGKTTTVRLLAAIAAAAGRCAGITSTDRVCVGDEVIEEGDWSGPGGARLVLRDRRTEVGLLETARGGMLRRGLAIEACDVAAVLNVAADHLGEWGVGTLQSLAEGKFVVTRVARCVVLNADDAVVLRLSEELACEVVWFTLEPDSLVLAHHVARGGRAAWLENGALWMCHGTQRERLIGVDEVPITIGGAARYNVANALAAAAIAERLGFSLDEIRAGLRDFKSDRHANPGRMNQFEFDGVRAICDFAHNPHGFEALFDLVRHIPAKRRLVLLGQAGDREEASVREMVAITVAAHFDMIVIKELTEHLRGRELGEVPAIIESELRALGVPEDRFIHCASELEAVDWALAWAQPGDLLLLLAHDKRDEVLERLEAHAAR